MTQTIEVTHVEKEYKDGKFFDGEKTRVAFVIVDENKSLNEKLEYAYRWTQNIHDGWSMDGEMDGNVNVIRTAPLHEKDGEVFGLRSTSVGDFMTLDNVKYVVSEIGFKEVK
jgi:hypothetical protein